MKPILIITITGMLLALIGWSQPAKAGSQTVIVCNPQGQCNPVIIMTPDDNSGMMPVIIQP